MNNKLTDSVELMKKRVERGLKIQKTIRVHESDLETILEKFESLQEFIDLVVDEFLHGENEE